MKSARICLLSLACVSGAVGFGVIANAAIDLVVPANPVTGSIAAVQKPAIVPVVAAEEPAQPASFQLASATSTPVDLGPVKVKTVPIVYREPVDEVAAPAPAPVVRARPVPIPRPRPVMASAGPIGQSAVQAIASATKTAPAAEDDPL